MSILRRSFCSCLLILAAMLSAGAASADNQVGNPSIRHWQLLAVDGESLWQINLNDGQFTRLGACTAVRLIYVPTNDTLYGVDGGRPVFVDRNNGSTSLINENYVTFAQAYSPKKGFCAVVQTGGFADNVLVWTDLYSDQIYQRLAMETNAYLTAIQPDAFGNFWAAAPAEAGQGRGSNFVASWDPLTGKQLQRINIEGGPFVVAVHPLTSVIYALGYAPGANAPGTQGVLATVNRHNGKEHIVGPLNNNVAAVAFVLK